MQLILFVFSVIMTAYSGLIIYFSNFVKKINLVISPNTSECGSAAHK